jgi:hypothetical protein
MKVYHFTNKKMLESILANGLTKGTIPVLESNKAILVGPFQWLTSNKEFDQQSWAKQILLPYSRTEVRVQITVPKHHRGKLIRARWGGKYDLPNNIADALYKLTKDWEGSEDWFVFNGIIPPGWIREITEYKAVKEG